MFIEQQPVFDGALPGDGHHSAGLYDEIVSGLSLGVASGDAALATVFARKANVFLTLKYSLDSTQRARLAALLLRLVAQDDVDLHLAHSFAATAARLAKKDALLTRDRLVVPWRPLWVLIKRASFPHKRDRVFNIDAVYIQEILKLVRATRHLFADDATKEILDEFMPDVSPHSLKHMQNIVGHMTVFLPTKNVPDSIGSEDPWFYWIPTLFGIWSLSSGAAHLDKSILSVLARVAEDQVAHPELTRFSEEMIQVVWECGMSDMQLPVGSGGGAKGGGRGKANMSLIPYLAKFIVNTIFPPQATPINGYMPPTNTLTLLQTFLQASESYFHPSNHGAWSVKLASLLHHLSVLFLKRWRKESLPECSTPLSLRLTPDIKREFVESVQTCAFLSMFSKDARAVNEANGAIKSLAYLEPGLVLPKVLERVFPALQTLTETHRTQACLNNLGVTILPILNRQLFPAGAQHFVDLLNLTLPGIDMNDPMKTTSTFVFISSAFMGVPIVDVSSTMVDEDESEEDREVRFSTAGLEEWLVMFLNRIFVMFENLPQIHGSSDENTMESVLLSMATYSLQIIFQQTTPEIHELALKTLHKFLSTNVIASATKAVGKILSIAGGASFQSRKLHHFLPLTSARIREELASGASSTPSLPKTSFPFGFASLSDATLHWHQYAFLCTLANAGESLLAYRGLLEGVISEMVEGCKSFRGVKWAAKAVQVAVYSLTGVYPKEFRSAEPGEWDDPAFMASSYKHWGHQPQASNFSVTWHTPTPAELDFAVSLLTKYTHLALTTLTTLISASQSTPPTSSDTRRDQSFEFTRWILVLKSLIVSVNGLIAPWDDVDVSPLSETPLQSGAWPPSTDPTPKPSVGYLSRTNPHYPTVSHMRFEMGQMLLTLVQHFEQFREDDVTPITQVIKGVSMFVSVRGVKAGVLAKQINGYKYIKGIVGSVENGKRLPRYLLVKRAQNLHLHRLRFCFSHCSILTVQTKSLLTCLFNLSLSQYAHLRAESQSALQHCLVPFESLKREFYKTYLMRLTAPAAAEHVVKGCLHVLHGTTLQDMARSDVECSWLFVKAICMPFGDKPSIQELVRTIFVTYLAQTSRLSIGFDVAEEVRVAVGREAELEEAVVARGLGVMEKKRGGLVQMYNVFMNDMIALISLPSTHWRARAMAVNLLEVAWRPQDMQPATLTRVVLEGVVSAHPTFRDVALSLLVRIVRSVKARAKVAGTDRTKGVQRSAERGEGEGVDTEAYLRESVGGGTL
ncbi:hypothetical protein HDU98_002714 [Podochytrium sp. JEL0797]|nr:hypothetical protein HDU98_002714 [Podochytrium sp. JEL0797]